MEYGILIMNQRGGQVRYRTEGEGTWELEAAAAKAIDLLERPGTRYVTVGAIGSDSHEFRLINENGNDATERWAPFYVDSQIGDRRFRYHPLADLFSLEQADELAEEAACVEGVQHVWWGASDGSEEYDSPVVQ